MSKRSNPVVITITIEQRKVLLSKLCIVGAIGLAYVAERLTPGIIPRTRKDGSWRS